MRLKMKLLFVNLPFSGHIFPTLGLVKELTKRNVEVTYLITLEWEERVRAAGAEFSSYENHKKLSVQMRNAYDAALKIADQFDLIIYEQYFFLGKHLAEKCNKPVVRIFTPLAANDKLMDMYLNAGGMFRIFRSDFICRKWTRKVANGIPLKTDSWLKEITHNPPELNLVYTIKEYQPYANEFPDEHYKFLGPSIYQRNQEPVISIENIKKPLIYISLGTVLNISEKFYKKCFSAFKNENVSVVMSVGNKVDLDNLGDIPDNFLVYPFVPQLDVLKKADVFITHGGFNSISEALYFGVPMVVIPAITDQPVNASRIVELNLGKRLNRKHITVALLNGTTISVLHDDKIRQNILDMQKKMRTAGGNKYGADLIINYAAKDAMGKWPV